MKHFLVVDFANKKLRHYNDFLFFLWLTQKPPPKYTRLHSKPLYKSYSLDIPLKVALRIYFRLLTESAHKTYKIKQRIPSKINNFM